jgi:hypothetical protein
VLYDADWTDLNFLYAIKPNIANLKTAGKAKSAEPSRTLGTREQNFEVSTEERLTKLLN